MQEFPVRKTWWERVFELVMRVDPNGKRVRLIIVGPSRKDVLQLPVFRSRGISKLPGLINVPGPKTHP